MSDADETQEDFADEDLNLDALTKLLEADDENPFETDSLVGGGRASELNASVDISDQSSVDAHKVCHGKEKGVDAASLGLTLSDEDSDDNNTSVSKRNDRKEKTVKKVQSSHKKKKNAFEAALLGNTSTDESCSSSAIKETGVDPLEQELRTMEERMKNIKAELIKKKKLNWKDSEESQRFTKLTDHCSVVKEKAKILTQEEKRELLCRLANNKSSVMHAGDTDSEDDEDQRNPFETLYDSYGRSIKKQLGSKSNNHYSSSSSGNSSNSASGTGSSSASVGSLSSTGSSFSKAFNISSSSGSTLSSSYPNKQKPKPAESTDMLAVKRQKVLSKIQGTGSLSSASGALQPLGSQHLQQSKKVEGGTKCQYSGIYIMNPVVSQSTISDRMEGRRYLSLPTIPLHVRGGEVEGDWVTIAVLVAKGQPKTSQKGSQYSIWQLSDLRDCTKSVGFFLFAAAHTALWKLTVGSVLGILNPQIMKDRQGDSSSNLLTLSVNNPQLVMEIGTARDLGWCKGRTKAGAVCRQFVNKNVCEFCIYHVQREYQKTASKRADLQSSFSRGGPKNDSLAQRVLGKDQVFYGGHLYNGSAPVVPSKQSSSHKAKDLATLSSLKLKMKSNTIREEDKQKSFVLKHLSSGELNAVQKMVQGNDSLGDRLLAPTPGARNLLRHMAKEEHSQQVAAGEVVAVSAKDLLKMTQQQHKARNMQLKQLSGSRSSPSPAGPTLARGFEPGQDIDLGDCSVPKKKFDPAKAKALAILKRKGEVLQTAAKNSVRSKEKSADPKYKEQVQKRLRESTPVDEGDGVNDRATKKMKVNETSRSLLGSIDINTDKIKEMMEKKSRHSNLVNDEEDALMDKYYNKLEQKEKLEEQMASIFEVPTKAVVCKICKYQSVIQSQYCKDQGHMVKSVKAVKRFFECSKCKRRTVCLEKMPLKSCSNCEASSWKRVAMGKTRKGPTLDSEVLCLRGNEQAHYSGGAEKAFLNIDG